jgi:photosystem II stability/assembly factor-like uncharacterized protein
MSITLTRRGFGRAACATLAAPVLAVEPGWAKLPTEPYKGKQDDISLIDPDTGWYGNGQGKLYRTRDGGLSWQKIWDQPGTFIRALGFADAARGWLGNVGTGYYPGVTDSHPLYATSDGGTSWQKVEAPGITAVAGICGIDVLQERRVFQGELQVAEVIHAAGRVGGPAMLLRSTDSGASWSVHDLTQQAGMILDVKFHDRTIGFVASATDSDVEKAHAQILATSDGGKSWTPVWQGSRPFENVWKMAWPSAKTGYATVQSYNPDPANTRRLIIKTVDGGRSWRELPLVEAPGVQQFGIGFVDDKRGWVGCRANGYETRDGGVSWAPVEMGKAINKVRIVRKGGVTRAFAIGTDVYRLDL